MMKWRYREIRIYMIDHCKSLINYSLSIEPVLSKSKQIWTILQLVWEVWQSELASQFRSNTANLGKWLIKRERIITHVVEVPVLHRFVRFSGGHSILKSITTFTDIHYNFFDNIKVVIQPLDSIEISKRVSCTVHRIQCHRCAQELLWKEY